MDNNELLKAVWDLVDNNIGDFTNAAKLDFFTDLQGEASIREAAAEGALEDENIVEDEELDVEDENEFDDDDDDDLEE